MPSVGGCCALGLVLGGSGGLGAWGLASMAGLAADQCVARTGPFSAPIVDSSRRPFVESTYSSCLPRPSGNKIRSPRPPSDRSRGGSLPPSFLIAVLIVLQPHEVDGSGVVLTCTGSVGCCTHLHRQWLAGCNLWGAVEELPGGPPAPGPPTLPPGPQGPAARPLASPATPPCSSGRGHSQRRTALQLQWECMHRAMRCA